MLQLAWTISVEDVMSSAGRAASCTWPRPTQPTLSTWWASNNPVESVTRSIGDACCLACLDARCRAALTAAIVCVELWSPLLACCRQTVAHVSSNNTATIIHVSFKMHNAKHKKHSKTHFIFGEKCAHFSALYYVNALQVFLGFSFPCVLKLNLK